MNESIMNGDVFMERIKDLDGRKDEMPFEEWSQELIEITNDFCPIRVSALIERGKPRTTEELKIACERHNIVLQVAKKNIKTRDALENPALLETAEDLEKE